MVCVKTQLMNSTKGFNMFSLASKHYYAYNSQFYSLYVTVHAKTSQVRTKIEIHFLPQLIDTYISYLHNMSPMARLNWSAFLGDGFTTL